MKRKLALIFMTCAAGSAFAQDGAPNCVFTNYDQGKDVFTVANATPSTMNQQCFITVSPAGTPGRFVEGQYEITLAGGGGGGGGGSAAEGGGGGGAGALPVRTVRYLNPGVYRMTIGRGGQGGVACLTAFNGGRAGDGNPTSISEAYTGETIAGFPRAEYWAGRPAESYLVASSRGTPAILIPEDDGSGGRGIGGQSSGGTGALLVKGGPDRLASDGTMLVGVSWGGMPGKAGNSVEGRRLAFAGGGGGGAGFGNGGDGHSLGAKVAKAGELSAGGGGGAGGEGTCAAGARGGDGFIKMSLLTAQAAPAAPAPRTVMPAEVPPPQPIVRPLRRDRN